MSSNREIMLNELSDMDADERAALMRSLDAGDADADAAGVADAHAAVEPYPPINGDTWIGPWPDREWLIEGWLPVGRLGMLSGRGGRGKSRLALQLVARMAASPAARGPFVPAARGPGNDTAVSDANLALDATHAGPVVYASWEDEREEAGRRIAKFGADELATPADLAGRLRYLDLRGEGPLWGPGGEARHLAALGELTPVGRRVRATCEALDARLLVVDSLAGAYGSDENVRALVRAFCADWDRWATDARCAVMLIVTRRRRPAARGPDRWIATTPDQPTGTARRAGAGRWTRPTRARPRRAGTAASHGRLRRWRLSW